VRALHQFVPTFEPGAIGGHVLELQRLAREELGLESEVFAEHLRWPGREQAAHAYRAYGSRKRPARPGDVLVYHMAIGSVVADFVRDRPEPLVMDHHNITPPSYYALWDPAAAHGCNWGRAQLADMAPRCALGVGDSPFNEEELRWDGYAPTATAPILLDLDRLTSDVDASCLDRLLSTKAGAEWLFVGRVSPNKCQHDVVKAFAAYRRMYDPQARLHLVGGSSADAYVAAIEGFAAEMGLHEAVRLTGSVTAGQLEAHYRAADVFVCLSEHEGFCIPLLEAMAHSTPIVAFAAAAVPGTLADGGVLLDSKEATTVAAAVHRVVADKAVRDAVVEAGGGRLADFSLDRTRARWVEVLQGVDG
jgi:glycosyltransferase involved in cell wall biosynthesis